MDIELIYEIGEETYFVAEFFERTFAHIQLQAFADPTSQFTVGASGEHLNRRHI